MSKRVDKLLNITVGDLREKLAYADSDDLFKDWLYNADEFDEVEDDHEDYDSYEDEDYDDWDDEEDDYWDSEDDESEVEGSLSLPSEEEEKLAMDIADDIDDGKYSVDNIRNLYSSEFIARVEYLID